MIRLTRQYRFAASHRLHSDRLSEAGNRAVYGKCNNPFGHGHDYVLQVTANGPVSEQTGLTLRLADLDTLVESAVLVDVRDRNLNDLADFQHLVPTTENLAAVAELRLRARWRGAFPGEWPQLVGVRILETRRNTFETSLIRSQ